MALRFSIALLFTTLTIQSYSQIDIVVRKQKLKPVLIDTTRDNVLIYEVPNAFLYFKQDDIKNFIDNSSNKSALANSGYRTLQDTLTKSVRQIKIKDIYFYYDQSQRDSIFRTQPENILTKQLCEEFYFLGAALILNGHFTVYSKSGKKFISKGVFAKREKGYLGQRTLEFYLPDKKQFYQIITALGE